jgi:tetratricopeptide (TPR) repeat protein
MPAHLSRTVLLTLALLSACAAADPNEPAAPPAEPGASGAFLQGRHALDASDVNEAADAFLRALAAEPGDADLRQQAFIATVMADRPEAVALAGQLPDNLAAQLVLAGQDAAAGRWGAAAVKFSALPDQGINQVLRPLLMAWAKQGAGQTDDALALLRLLANTPQYRGIFALHAALIEDVAGRQPDAGQAYGVAQSESGGWNLRLGMILASWQARNGHEADARQTIRAMVDAAPTLEIAEPALQQDASRMQVTTAKDGVAESYLALAATLQQQNAPEFAQLLLHLALQLRPQFTAARLLMSDLQLVSRQYALANKTLAAVPASDSLIAVVELRRANIAQQQKRPEEASRILEQVAAAYPKRSEPLAMLGEMQARNGKFAESAATYGRAIERAGPDSPQEWALYYERGTSYERAHNWPRAEADLLRALDLSPDQPSALNYLGYTWAEQGRHLPKARAMLERAVELRPNDGAIADSLGWVLLRQGDAKEAAHWLERAVELEPEDSSINAHLGDAYWAANRHPEAQTQWRRALILHPEPEDEQKLQAKLAGNVPSTAVQHSAP